MIEERGNEPTNLNGPCPSIATLGVFPGQCCKSAEAVVVPLSDHTGSKLFYLCTFRNKPDCIRSGC